MKRIRGFSIAAIGAAGALGLLLVVSAEPVHSAVTVPTAPVKVVNTAAEPVPTAAQGTTNVAGTVQIGGTPTVLVGNSPIQPVPTIAQGTTDIVGTVQIGGTPSVLVGNSPVAPLFVRDVVANQLQPIHFVLDGTFVEPRAVAVPTSSGFTVPAGTRLVIEHVSLSVLINGAGQSVFAHLTVLDPSGSPILGHTVRADLIGNFSGQDIFGGGGPVHLYLDAGQSVRLDASRNSGTGTGAMEINISGYLVPITS